MAELHTNVVNQSLIPMRAVRSLSILEQEGKRVFFVLRKFEGVSAATLTPTACNY